MHMEGMIVFGKIVDTMILCMRHMFSATASGIGAVPKVDALKT